MNYIGGQCKVQCNEHKLPFIVSDKITERCYQNLDEHGNICNRKISFMCPNLRCTSGICKKCFDGVTSDEIQYIFPPVPNIHDVTFNEQSESLELDEPTNDVDAIRAIQRGLVRGLFRPL